MDMRLHVDTVLFCTLLSFALHPHFHFVVSVSDQKAARLPLLSLRDALRN